ncbi:MAG: acyl carrier protein [Bacteroidetes bacterium HGW-Bacteroidetes-12]|nr:MAG: acyl carrier protein [Bacteroidetes bacterium HGW-Bacteroidetes-12]
MENLLHQLNNIMREVFENKHLIITNETSAKDIAEWNSLNHVLLIAEIEKKFNVSFSLDEMISFANVGDIVTCLKTKI